MDAVREDVIKLVHKELESANKKFPAFHNAHEGWAVILEEVEEAEEQVKYVRQMVDAVWMCVKNNNHSYSVERFAQELMKCAINGAIELIQVAAMAQKFIDSLGGGENNI